MIIPEGHTNQLLTHLFRIEYTKLTAVLCRLFGLKEIEVAEDIASETFLKAAEAWSINGVPENPTAWLYTVAKNKTKDYLKRNNLFHSNVSSQILKESAKEQELTIEFSEQAIKDSQLAMIFAVCDPVNSFEAQICLALQVLCGFSIEEIANSFLTNKETIKKRLFRARENLRNQSFKPYDLQFTEIASRLDTVLTTLYLLFNEGYFSKTTNLLIRKDLCSEAIRLTLLLTEHAITNTPKANALLALLCFQSSRLEARTDGTEAVLFEQQDRELWNQELIDKGNYYLIRSCSDPTELSKYHLEASIAYWHTTNELKKWDYILQLYNQLLLIEYSPVTALNRTFALAKVFGAVKAIDEAEKLDLQSNSYYHSLLGYLYAEVDPEKASHHFTQALNLTKSHLEKIQLNKYLNLLQTKNNS